MRRARCSSAFGGNETHAPCGGAMLGKATHGVARIAQREVPRMLEEVVTDPDWKIHPGLPGRDYHAQDVWELEKERIFSRNWFCVGREEQVTGPGEYLVQALAGESVIVIRDKDGAIRAFANVCRHR